MGILKEGHDTYPFPWLTFHSHLANYFRLARRPKIGHHSISGLHVRPSHSLGELPHRLALARVHHRLTQLCLVARVDMHRVASSRQADVPAFCVRAVPQHNDLIDRTALACM